MAIFLCVRPFKAAAGGNQKPTHLWSVAVRPRSVLQCPARRPQSCSSVWCCEPPCRSQIADPVGDSTRCGWESQSKITWQYGACVCVGDGYGVRIHAGFTHETFSIYKGFAKHTHQLHVYKVATVSHGWCCTKKDKVTFQIKFETTLWFSKYGIDTTCITSASQARLNLHF